jgi:hypothetical protein
MGEITYIEETYTHFSGPRRFLLVSLAELLIPIGPYSFSSSMFFKISKRLFKGRREKVKFVWDYGIYVLLVQRIYESIVDAI